MKTKKDEPETRTMVILYKDDLRAIEKLRRKFVGLPKTRYHSEVMRRAVIEAAGGLAKPVTDELKAACEKSDDDPTKHAVVLRGLEKTLERFQKTNGMDSVSSALRLVLRSVAG